MNCALAFPNLSLILSCFIPFVLVLCASLCGLRGFVLLEPLLPIASAMYKAKRPLRFLAGAGALLVGFVGMLEASLRRLLLMPEAGVVFAQDLIQKVNHLFHNRSSLRLSIIPSSFRFHCGHAGVVSLGSLRLFAAPLHAEALVILLQQVLHRLQHIFHKSSSLSAFCICSFGGSSFNFLLAYMLAS